MKAFSAILDVTRSDEIYIFFWLILLNNRNVYTLLEHDDRDRQPTDIQIRKNKGGNRRVSFKPSKLSSIAKNNVKSRTAEMGLRTHFEEDDEMIEFENSRNKASTFRRRNSPVPRSARNNRAKQLVESASGWFLVTVSIYNAFFVIGCMAHILNQLLFTIPELLTRL